MASSSFLAGSAGAAPNGLASFSSLAGSAGAAPNGLASSSLANSADTAPNGLASSSLAGSAEAAPNGLASSSSFLAGSGSAPNGLASSSLAGSAAPKGLLSSSSLAGSAAPNGLASSSSLASSAAILAFMSAICFASFSSSVSSFGASGSGSGAGASAGFSSSSSSSSSDESMTPSAAAAGAFASPVVGSDDVSKLKLPKPPVSSFLASGTSMLFSASSRVPLTLIIGGMSDGPDEVTTVGFDSLMLLIRSLRDPMVCGAPGVAVIAPLLSSALARSLREPGERFTTSGTSVTPPWCPPGFWKLARAAILAASPPPIFFAV